MPTLSFVREGIVASVDTDTKLTGTGQGDTAQDAVSTGMNSIKHIAVTTGIDGAAGQGNIIVVFKGPALKYGEQRIAVGSHSNIGTTVAVAAGRLALDVDIALVPDKTLEVWACLAGDDTGSPEIAVTTTMSSAPGGHAYVTRQGDPGTADTYATLTTENGVTTVNDQQVTGKAIDQVIVAASQGPTTQEPYTTLVRIQGVGGSIFGNEHGFGGPANLTSDGTLADGYIVGAMVYNVDIPVTKGTVRVQAVDSGATVTDDSMVAVTLAYRM